MDCHMGKVKYPEKMVNSMKFHGTKVLAAKSNSRIVKFINDSFY